MQDRTLLKAPFPVVCGPGCRRSQWVPPPDLNWTWCVLLLPGCLLSPVLFAFIVRQAKNSWQALGWKKKKKKKKPTHTLGVQKPCWRVLVRSGTENSSSLLFFSHFPFFHARAPTCWPIRDHMAVTSLHRCPNITIIFLLWTVPLKTKYFLFFL